MRSTTSTLSTLLIPTLAVATLLIGCGNETAPTPAATTERTATPPADLAGGLPPADRPGAALPGATPPGSIFDAPGSASDMARAREVLVETGRVYREAPTLTDELSLSADGRPPQVLRLRFDRNNERAEMALPTETATFIDGSLLFTRKLMHDLYLVVESDDAAIAIAQTLNWVPPYHFAMRADADLSDEAAADFYLAGLGLGILRNPRLRGYTLFTDDDGRQFHRITIDANTGSGHVFIDAKTNLVTHMELQILPAPGQPAHHQPTRMRVDANPVIADELAEPIVFDPGDREKVLDIQAMVERPLGPGDRAPNYRFQTADGETVRLADLRGYVVILDFWATWCVPCIQGLPHLDRFAKWVDDEGRPVKVFAVNTMEQHPTFEERTEAVAKFWTEREFTVPLAYDVEGVAVPRTGYGNIPLLLVIDPEGRITRVKDRFNRNMYQILKAEVDRALRGAGGQTEGDDDD